MEQNKKVMLTRDEFVNLFTQYRDYIDNYSQDRDADGEPSFKENKLSGAMNSVLKRLNDYAESVSFNFKKENFYDGFITEIFFAQNNFDCTADGIDRLRSYPDKVYDFITAGKDSKDIVFDLKKLIAAL